MIKHLVDYGLTMNKLRYAMTYTMACPILTHQNINQIPSTII